MTSLNPLINQLHQAFCEATGRNITLVAGAERWWYNAIQCEITPDMVRQVMLSRIKRSYSTTEMRLHCLSLRHLIGDDERLAQFVDEHAQLEAMKRKRVFSPGKAEALRATGRPGEPELGGTRHVCEVFEAMRRAG